MSFKQFLHFLSPKGFSLAETLISAALLGGVGVTMLTIDDSQSVDENFSATDMIIETLYQGIYMAMEDPEACTKTLHGGPAGKRVYDGKVIQDIVGHNGTTLISKGGKDSREMIQVTQIVLRGFDQRSGHNYAEVNMKVTFKKLSRQLAQNSGGTEREITLDIPLQLDMVPGGNELESCFLPSTESANTMICRQFFGEYDHKTQECTLPFYGKNCTAPSSPGGKCLRSMAKFDSQAQFDCVTTSIEPNNSPSCPW